MDRSHLWSLLPSVPDSNTHDTITPGHCTITLGRDTCHSRTLYHHPRGQSMELPSASSRRGSAWRRERPSGLLEVGPGLSLAFPVDRPMGACDKGDRATFHRSSWGCGGLWQGSGSCSVWCGKAAAPLPSLTIPTPHAGTRLGCFCPQPGCLHSAPQLNSWAAAPQSLVHCPLQDRQASLPRARWALLLTLP